MVNFYIDCLLVKLRNVSLFNTSSSNEDKKPIRCN